jgi:uncharacterized protein YbjT (DUF2867 family)
MTRLVILGGTGMVGGAAIRYAIQNPGVEHVTSVGRRRLGIVHPKLTEVVHSTFTDCTPLAGVLANQDAAIFCLGTYTGAVSDTALRRITVDYTVEFARVFRGASPNAGFTFLSGNGADPTGRSRMAFARYKGAAEKALLAAGFPHLYVFRPAYIYPVERRREPTFGYRLMRWAYPGFRLMFPNLVIRSDDLARVMVEVSVSDTGDAGSLTFENRDIQVMADSSVTQDAS